MQKLIADVFQSFFSLPRWVQLWMVLILMPVNIASLFFLSQPGGILIAFLANIGVLLNIPVVVRDRGFSKAMALPHLVPWTLVVLIILFTRPEGSAGYGTYLTILALVNIISLVFDYPDAYKWWKGDRAVAGRS